VAEGLKVNPATSVDEVGHTGIYPASGPWPTGDAPLRGQGELAHPEERARRIPAPSVPLLAVAAIILLGVAAALMLSGSGSSTPRAT
jgi:hypothetical protein